MTVFKRWLYGSLAVAMLAGPAGLLLRHGMSQEGHEEARPIVAKEEPRGENPFEARNDREREQREHSEAREPERAERPTERDILKHQVEVLRIALHALMEAEKRDAAEVVQRAIRAREVTLEERRDDEAHMIRERAPGREQLAEILKMASNVWREFNNQDKAEVVGRLAREFAGSGEREREQTVRERSEPEKRPNELARRRLQELEQALVRAREAGREDEAARIRRQMQELTQQREGEPEQRPAREETPRVAEDVERLKGSVRELSGQMNELRREMAEIRKLLETLTEQKREER